MPDFDKMLEDAMDNPILSEAADEIGKNLLEALIGELVLIPHPSIANQNVWSTRKEVDQDATIDRFTRRIRAEVTRAFGQILAAGNPAAQALLKDVKFTGKGITATLDIDKHCGERHALADFADRFVAVIMPDDIESYFETMGDIVATADQASLDLDTNGASDEQNDAMIHEESMSRKMIFHKGIASLIRIHLVAVKNQRRG